MRLRCLRIAAVVLLAMSVPASAAFTNNIMLTGYWPPTNEMLRPFSPNQEQNPDGWIGQDWEGRGYDVYAYFPEFNGPNDNIGYGDFEVDYQDTSDDFWRITDEIHPVAIITFGAGVNSKPWEIEYRQRNLATWVGDYRTPYQPTPAPPAHTRPAGTNRYSSLPMTEIRSAVNSAGLGITAMIDSGADFAGGFLCEYIAYHATWYHDMRCDLEDPNWYWNMAAGHIHVAPNLSINTAQAATEVTLRALTNYLDTVVPEPATALLVLGALWALPRRRRTSSTPR